MKLLQSKLSLREHWPFLAIFLAVFSFFWQFFLIGKLPIPVDTIVGLYHPWRDVVWNGLSAGVPFKNFLITDSVRQQISWRELALNVAKEGKIPLWNPYSFSGTPLLANFQSAFFYPLNIFFYFFSFPTAWSILVILQPLLGGFFLYIYLRHINLSREASLFGAVIFCFSGFNIAWLTWNTLVHTLIWLPLILLSIDKVFLYLKSSQKKMLLWLLIFIFSMSSSLFAGHLQVFFYVFLFSFSYLLVPILKKPFGERFRPTFIFIIGCFGFLTLTAIQWLPTMRFIALSDRGVSEGLWQRSDWFIPWSHLIQFISPDFFGNPATLNYWGIWNYGEFVGYVGIFGLIFALTALFFTRQGKVNFFKIALLISLLFALPTPVAKIPFVLKLPLVATSQPSRLLAIIDFTLAILAGFGFDYYWSRVKSKNSVGKVWWVVLLMSSTLAFLWVYTVLGGHNKDVQVLNHLSIARNNLILPTVLVFLSVLTFFFLPKISRFRLKFLAFWIVFAVTIVDLFRFGFKFTPFASKEWFYPNTNIISYLQNQREPFRFMSADNRIFPPNFSVMYRLQTVEGYDPLYLKRYGEFIGAWNRGRADLSFYDFNRIITPQDYNSRLADLTNVKYVLSLKDESSPKLKLIMKEGDTRLYENLSAYPRAFLVEAVNQATTREQTLDFLFKEDVDLRKVAVIENPLNENIIGELAPSEGVEMIEYQENQVRLHSGAGKNRFLVLSDNYYPGWKAYVDGQLTKIYRTDFTFRGIVVPPGEHEVKFVFNSLL